MNKDTHNQNPLDLNTVKTDALDATAEAIRRIRTQYALSEDCGLDCMKTLDDAVFSAEDAMFYLASVSSDDDDDRLREILTSYGMESILGDSASGE